MSGRQGRSPIIDSVPVTALQSGPTWPLMYEPVFGGLVPARPGAFVGGRHITVDAQEQFERAVVEMRAQFLAVSGQIADELTRLTQHAAVSSPAVRDRVVMAVGQIAATQQFLRVETERLPSDPQERYAIMDSVLQAQQGALHQLAIIRQHAPGWYPGSSQTAAWYPSVPGSGAWPQGPQPSAGTDPNGSNGAPSYPSPPTVQDLVTRGWPQAHGNGYADAQPPGIRSIWPAAGTSVAMVPYAGSPYVDASAHGPWPGRRTYVQPAPVQYEVSELRPHPGNGSSGQVVARRRRTDVVTYGGGSNKLLWTGLGVLALIFVWLSFPWEIRRKDAIAEQKVAADAVEERSAPAPAVVPPAPPPPRTVASPPPAPTLIARAPEVEAPPAPPPVSPPASTVIVLPGGLQAGSPNVAVGTLWPTQSGAPAGRVTPPVETAYAPAEPAPAPVARTRERVAAARAEPETPAPAPAEAAPRAERFVAVLFTHQDEPTVAKAFVELQQQYPQVLGSRQGETQAVNLGKKGVWHRLVVLPAGSRQDAANLCGQLTGSGYDKCWVKLY